MGGVARTTLNELCYGCELLLGDIWSDNAGVEEKAEEAGLACDPRMSGGYWRGDGLSEGAGTHHRDILRRGE